MKEENTSQCLSVKYVGNTLHVIIHLADNLFFLHDQLQLYLDKYCRNTTSLSTALQNDSRHPIIIMQLTSLGFMGKCVKGYQVDTLPMCTSTKDVFEKQMSQDSVLALLQAPIVDAKDKMKKMEKILLFCLLNLS